MRNVQFLTAIFLFFTLPLAAQIRLKTQLNKHDTLPAGYKNSTQKPCYVLRGSQLMIETDTIYLLNTLRYDYYQRLQDLKEMVESDNAEGIALEIIKSYERALDSCKNYYQLLLKNAEKTDATSYAFLEKTKETVDMVKITLNKADERLAAADEKLKSANLKLTEASNLIKKSRRKTILQKIVIGASCLLLGFAVGKL